MLQAPVLLLISFLTSANIQAAALVSNPYPPPYVKNNVSYLQPTDCLFIEVDTLNRPVNKGLVIKTPVQKLANGSARCYWLMTGLPEMTKKFSVKALNGAQVSPITPVFLTRFFDTPRGVYLHFTQNPTWSQQ